MSVRRVASGDGESLACSSLAKTKLSIGLRGLDFTPRSRGIAGRTTGFSDQWVSAGEAEVLLLVASATTMGEMRPNDQRTRHPPQRNRLAIFRGRISIVLPTQNCLLPLVARHEWGGGISLRRGTDS